MNDENGQCIRCGMSTPLSEHPVCSSCEEKEFEDHKEESNRTFPTDNLRQLSSDSTPIAWSQDEVDKAMDLHLHLGRPNLVKHHRVPIEKLRETTVSRSMLKQNMTPTGLEPVLPA